MKPNTHHLVVLLWIGLSAAYQFSCGSVSVGNNALGPSTLSVPQVPDDSTSSAESEPFSSPSLDQDELTELELTDQELATEVLLDSEDVSELDAAGGAPISDPRRRAMEQAIEWAREGVDASRSGRRSEALKALADSRIVLLEANLPEPLQDLGLDLLNGALGTDYVGIQLEELARELRRDLESVAPELEERRLVEREARRILAKFGASSPDPAYLETFIDQVLVYIEYYQGRYREFFERAYIRKHKYWPTLSAILTARGIPEEQAYMALVESGFNPKARSHANARGLWQFIPSTGRRYGLRQTADFFDVVRSTEAASEYLLDLIGIFGSRSFLLAMASYNAGEGRIMKCLRKLDDPFAGRSYWAIRECLPQETRDYVPRILAAAIIGSNPKQFGFDLPTEDEMALLFDVVTIPSPTPLGTLAAQAGVSVAALRTANTDLSSRATTTPVRNFPLYLPKGGGVGIIAELSTQPEIHEQTELPLSVQVGAEKPPVVLVEPVVETGEAENLRRGRRPIEVTARAGDSLGAIASRHGVTVADIKSWNAFLRQRVLYRGDRLTIYPKKSAESTVYTVRRGDHLADIARRHGVSVSDLVSVNKLRSANRIQPGQKLEIRGTSSTRIVFTVKPGNSLQTIARLFEVRYRDILSWNGLKSSRLRVGQNLEIYPPRSFKRLTHRVRRGETVAKIARKYGVSASAVFTANGLQRRDVIHVGENMNIYIPR